jgi:hypothetical protein
MVQKRLATALATLLALGAMDSLVTTAAAGSGNTGPQVTTGVPTANKREGTSANILAPGFQLVPLVRGTDKLENPSGIITNFGLLNDFPSPDTVKTPLVEATKTEPDQNLYIVLERNPGGPTAGFKYGHHFLFQGHENGNNLSYVTRINLDVDANKFPAQRITLMTPVGTNGTTGFNATDGSAWYPLTQTLLFTQENGVNGGVFEVTALTWPSTITTRYGSIGRGGYEGIHPDEDGRLIIAEDVGGTSVNVNPSDSTSPKVARQPNSFIYKYVPTLDPLDPLGKGVLQALQVEIDGQLITFHANDAVGDTFADAQLKLHTPGSKWKARWITIHDTAVQGTASFASNALAKAAGATPFKRPENLVFLPGSGFDTFFFDATGDTNADSGNQPALAARGAWGAIFRVDIDADASEGTISLFVLGDKDHAAFDNLTFADRNTLVACEDRGDTLHRQLNTLDSCWVYSVTGDLNPRRFLALGRDDASLKDVGFLESVPPTAGYQNEGDNEPTGFFVSNGKQSSEDGAEGMYGTGRNLKGARWFFTQQHGNNVVFEIIPTK